MKTNYVFLDNVRFQRKSHKAGGLIALTELEVDEIGADLLREATDEDMDMSDKDDTAPAAGANGQQTSTAPTLTAAAISPGTNADKTIKQPVVPVTASAPVKQATPAAKKAAKKKAPAKKAVAKKSANSGK